MDADSTAVDRPSASPANQAQDTPLTKVPHHVAIIMDGNGRWANARGLPRTAGHRAGIESLRRIVRAALDFGVKVLTVYAFSTENWSRPRAEVQALLFLVNQGITKELNSLDENGVQIRHVGRTAELDRRLLARIRAAEEKTRHNDRLILNFAFNYGGRAEIVQAIQRIVADGVPAQEVTEETVKRYLWTGDSPDPDLVIRTAGEMRLSNFLIWQAAYAEFYSTPIFWPDFGRDDLYRALLEYQRRERRFGGLSDSG